MKPTTTAQTVKILTDGKKNMLKQKKKLKIYIKFCLPSLAFLSIATEKEK